MWRRTVPAFGLAALAGCAHLPVGAPPMRGIADIDVLHQVVEIAPFAEGGMMAGRQTMTFRTTTPGDHLGFHGGPLGLSSVQIDGQRIAGWSIADGVMDIPVERGLEAGSRHTLTVTYAVSPGRGVRRTADLAYTTYFACDWMLCDQSDFADRFTLDLTIRTPRGMLTLGPGEAQDVHPEGPDEKLHRWRSAEPFPAYVHAFAAGRLRSQDLSPGCSTRLNVLTNAPEEQVDKIFGPTCAMLTYFEERSGVPYPARRYSQLYVPDRAEAQEAASHSILGGAMVQPLLTDPTEDWAVAHELAHQWWGNRVTAADLSQFWLNEGVVTFMVATWKERRWGDEAYAREIGLARDRWTRCRQAWMDVPLAYAGDYPSLQARRCVQYSKAAVFLHELRQTMGDAVFWRGMRDFTTANLDRPVTSTDFERAMQATTSLDIHPLFVEWVYPAE